MLFRSPDYAALRKALVGVDAAEPAGIAPAPETPLPATPQTSPQRSVPGAVEPDPTAAQGPTVQPAPEGKP